jgi:hypothetical protein
MGLASAHGPTILSAAHARTVAARWQAGRLALVLWWPVPVKSESMQPNRLPTEAHWTLGGPGLGSSSRGPGPLPHARHVGMFNHTSTGTARELQSCWAVRGRQAKRGLLIPRRWSPGCGRSTFLRTLTVTSPCARYNIRLYPPRIPASQPLRAPSFGAG